MSTNNKSCGVRHTTTRIYGHEDDTRSNMSRHICKKKPGHNNKHRCKCGFKFLNMYRRDR